MNDDVRTLLLRPEFPGSNAYDPTWMLDNQMGSNALWLAKWLCSKLPLEPEIRVLDQGCGDAMTSIFLAREHCVRGWAADLWIGPDHNWRRIVEAGCADRVCPLRRWGSGEDVSTSQPGTRGQATPMASLEPHRTMHSGEFASAPRPQSSTPRSRSPEKTHTESRTPSRSPRP